MNDKDVKAALAEIEQIGAAEKQGILADMAKGLRDGLAGLAKIADMTKAEYGMEEEEVEGDGDDLDLDMGGEGEGEDEEEEEEEDPRQMMQDPGAGAYDMGKGGGHEFLDVTETVEALQKSVARMEVILAALAKSEVARNAKIDAILRAQPILAKGIQGISGRMAQVEAPSRGEGAFRPTGRRDAPDKSRSGLSDEQVFDGMLKGVIDESHSRLWDRTGKLSADADEHKRLVAAIKAA